MKPGWQTTEFWKSLLSQIVGIGVILHVVNSDDANTLSAQVTTVIEGVFSIVATVGSLAIYIKSRTTLKAENTEAGK